MSTNFYWKAERLTCTVQLANGATIEMYVNLDDPDIHIGKRVRAVGGLKFNWAQQPRAVRDFCAAHHAGPKANQAIVFDDAGREYTAGEFLEALSGCQQHDPCLVGQRFS